MVRKVRMLVKFGAMVKMRIGGVDGCENGCERVNECVSKNVCEVHEGNVIQCIKCQLLLSNQLHECPSYNLYVQLF